ncbi:MAG: hypothetical protein M0R37_02780 [Bacteroidales bacterium]|nr:hypothetical protein [Bacteroidales bacterium]
MALVLLSCDEILNDRKIWDISPVEVTLQVVDANGVDILNPDSKNSIPENGLKALYNGVEYKCNENLSEVGTKAYLPHFYGLKVYKSSYYGTYILQFGEFDGTNNYSNEEVIISWGDGSYDKIRFNRKFRWKLNGDPSISQEWFLNGTKVSDGLIKIVK